MCEGGVETVKQMCKCENVKICKCLRVRRRRSFSAGG
jgi:hypothetical protein